MDDLEQLAADYALGTLEAAARTEVEVRARSDDALRRLIDEWERRLVPLAGDVPRVEPPQSVFERIRKRLDTTAAPPPGTRTVRARDGHWQRLGPGLRMKPLGRDPDAGRQTMLLAIEPGGVYPGHQHPGHEEMYILDGDLVFGEFELGRGDHHVAAAGGRHPTAVSRTGCTALVVTSL